MAKSAQMRLASLDRPALPGQGVTVGVLPESVCKFGLWEGFAHTLSVDTYVSEGRAGMYSINNSTSSPHWVSACL